MIQNRVIIFPTDTVYGIGASIYDKEGMDRIYAIKKRSYDKPLAVLCANLEQIDGICYLTDDAKKLIKAFLPGPLTLILKSKEVIMPSFNRPTVGVRIPNYDTALEILLNDGPMATTSVNESGQPSINNYSTIKDEYDDLVDAIYPPSGAKTSSLPSTVVDITGNEPRVLRVGAITLDMIMDCLKK